MCLIVHEVHLGHILCLGKVLPDMYIFSISMNIVVPIEGLFFFSCGHSPLLPVLVNVRCLLWMHGLSRLTSCWVAVLRHTIWSI